MNARWLAQLDAEAPSWSTADRDGSVGVDFLGTRSANLEMLTSLTGTYNNTVTSARQHAILAWAAWRFHRNWEGAAVAPTTADWRAFLDAVETIQLVGQLALGPGLGGVAGGLGSDSAKRIGGDGPVRLRFCAYERNRTTTSAMAAVQYGPSAKRGALGFLSTDGDAVAVTEDRGLALARAMDGLLSKSDRYALLTRREVPDSLPREDVLALARHGLVLPGPAHPERPERSAYVDALLFLDGVAATDRRPETVALLLHLVDAFQGATTGTLRRYMLAGRTAAGDTPPLPSPLLDTAARWRIFQLRQLQRYSLEAWLRHVELWMEDGLTDVRSMRDALVADVGSDPEPTFAELAPLLDRPASEALSGFQEVFDLPSLESWANGHDCDAWWILDQLGADEGIACAPALALTLGVLASIPTCVPPDPALRRFADTGGRTRISLLYFRDWFARRGQWPLREVLAELLEELVLQQHVGVAVARFDNVARRLRFSNGDRGWELLGTTTPTVPFITIDRIAAYLHLLTDLGLVEQDDARDPTWRVRPEGRTALARFLAGR